MRNYATFRQRFGLIDRYLNLEYVPMADIPVVEGSIIGSSRYEVGRRPASMRQRDGRVSKEARTE